MDGLHLTGVEPGDTDHGAVLKAGDLAELRIHLEGVAEHHPPVADEKEPHGKQQDPGDHEGADGGQSVLLHQPESEEVMNACTSSSPLASRSATVPSARIRPSCSITRRSPSLRALVMLCVTTTSVVLCSCFSPRSSSSISSDVSGSRPALGSSTSRIRGSSASARASPAR